MGEKLVTQKILNHSITFNGKTLKQLLRCRKREWLSKPRLLDLPTEWKCYAAVKVLIIKNI